MMDGYGHPGYAASLAEFGTVRRLSGCGGWILKRQIPEFPYSDAMGCYPLFTCEDWSQIKGDLENLQDEVVALSLVTDPFGMYSVSSLEGCFDRVLRFKEHFVVDLSRPAESIVSKHHHYYARRTGRHVGVECCAEPAQFTDEWVRLYSHLIQRHRLKGIKSFSRQAFARQLLVPGIVMFRASAHNEVVGAHLWYQQGEVAYSHLAAMSPRGYELMASYALYWYALDYFSGRVGWLDLGSAAGVSCNGRAGLDNFKKGWSTGTRTAYFCGRILNPGQYEEITGAKGISTTDYFPAYRRGEFV